MYTQEEVGYVYHPDYFLEELAGKGVFVSEEMSETEGFIAQLLMGHTNEDEIKAELEELYESLKKLATDGKN